MSFKRSETLQMASKEERSWRPCVICLAMLMLLVSSTTALEGQESEGPVVGSSSHWIHVQKCCPEAHMMVEVANKKKSTTHETGSKFVCKLQNDTTFRWAPDFLDDQNNLQPFEGIVDTDYIDADGVNMTKFCIPKGPCISSIVGKPQCGPVKYNSPRKFSS